MAKRPRDPNQLAKVIVDIATGQSNDTISEEKKHPKPKRGQAGGLKGGKARAAKLTSGERRAIGRKGAKARWKTSPSS